MKNLIKDNSGSVAYTLISFIVTIIVVGIIYMIFYTMAQPFLTTDFYAGTELDNNLSPDEVYVGDLFIVFLNTISIWLILAAVILYYILKSQRIGSQGG